MDLRKMFGNALVLCLTAATVLSFANPVVAKADETEKVEAEVNTDIDMLFEGTIMNESKDKTYVFTAPDNGYAQVTIKGADPTEEYSWSYRINNQNGATYESEIGEYGLTNRTSNEFTVTKGEKYYVTVGNEEKYWNREGILRFSFTKSDSWELEGNDSVAGAYALEEGKTITGTITYKNDVDYYKFDINKACKVKITVNAADPSTTGDWNVYLTNEDGQTKEIYEDIKSKQDNTFYLKNGTYYLSFDVYPGYGSKVGIKYNLSYSTSSLSIKTPTVKKIAGYTGSKYSYFDSISLKNAGTVDGYLVKIAKKKTMKGILYNEALSNLSGKNKIVVNKVLDKYTLSQKASTVYITVRPYVLDPFGNRIYGSISKVKAQILKKKAI